MPIKTPPPADIPYHFIGHPEPPDPEVFVGETVIPHWGVMKSIQIGTYRDNQPAFDIHQYDMGVKLSGGEIRLQMQFRDKGRDVSQHVYRVEGAIQFLGMTIDVDIDWPPTSTSKNGTEK